VAATRRETDPRWGEVVVKEATDDAGRARLQREAEVLGWCRSPGVVELLHHETGDDRAVLITRFCGSRTLLDLASLPADQVASLGASLAQTLADLHQLGVSHGSLLAEHVVLGDDGTPVLCGFAGAGLAEPSRLAPAEHPAAVAVAVGAEGSGFDPAADAEALAGLLRHLLQPVPTSRWRNVNPVGDLLDATPPMGLAELAGGLARQAGPRVAPLRRAPDAEDRRPPPAGVVVPTIDVPRAGAPTRGGRDAGARAAARPADQPQPEEVCGNEQLADWFFSDDLIDAPTRQFGPQPARRLAEDVDEHPSAWRRLLALVGLAALVLVIGAVTVLVVGGRSDPPPAVPDDSRADVHHTGDTDTGDADARSATTPEAPPGTTVASMAATTVPAGPADSPSEAGAAAPTPAQQPQAPSTRSPSSPAGCPTSHDDAARTGIAASCAGVAHAEGNRIVVGSLSWELGSAGDQAAVADFTCDGWLDAAALDTAGDVFVFDRWAGSGDDAATGRLVRHVEAAQRLESRSAGPGCGALAVVGAGDPVLLGPGDLG
jgi:cytoskeletal protein RodZ